MDEYNKVESIKAQEEYCKETTAPHFAPYDGLCFSCNRNIYLPVEQEGWQGRKRITGITTEKARTELITGCPHCYKTYCD